MSPFRVSNLRFFRLRFIPDSQCCREGQNTAFARYAVSELEVYGRGVVPEVRWESKVIDLGQVVNIGQVHFGVSTWRKDAVASDPPPRSRSAHSGQGVRAHRLGRRTVGLSHLQRLAASLPR